MTHKLPVNLTDAQIEEFGREMDAIYNEVMDSRGEKDRAYILKVIRTQRSMAVIGRIIIYAGLFFNRIRYYGNWYIYVGVCQNSGKYGNWP